MSFAFAEVILPLRVKGTFTYSIPDSLQEAIRIGKRVIVQFGSRRIYTAIVCELHDNKPELIQPKTIIDVLDPEPIIAKVHIEFWQWIAHYYMSTLGEVMNAALPSGMKLDSETNIAIHPYWSEDQTNLNHDEFIVTEALKIKPAIGLSELQQLLGKRSVHSVIKSLIEKNVVYAEEQLVEKYKPRYDTYIELEPELHDEDTLQEAFESLKRAPKQEELLVKFVQMVEDEGAVKKAQLLAESGISPGVLKQLLDKEFVVETKVEVDRLALKAKHHATRKFKLTTVQQDAFDQIKKHFESLDTVLLYAVTSAGKTQIYMEFIAKYLAQGKQVLYLLPEIALTAQLVNRLREVFGNQVGIYHSRFSANERVEIWQKVLSQEYKIVIGARSALFLPFVNLGLIVVDEEHDGSFKQFDPAPRYQARDAATYMAKQMGAKVLMGTATPSFETYHNVEVGKYGMVRLTERYGKMTLPVIEVANARDEMKKRKMKSIFTSVLYKEIEGSLTRGEQVILFHNRRGFAPYILCLDCGQVPKCENCDVSLSYHKSLNQLKCHYCGFRTDMFSHCQECKSTNLKVFGYGTEKVMEEVSALFPNAKVARLDYDATRTKESHTRIIEDFEEQKIDILVGTQMVTKGLDFDHVSLVGIMSADQLLGFPDFRASERGFQLIEQVSGRAGRKGKQGKVVIQSNDPEHPVIQKVLAHDFEGLYFSELNMRKQFSYPPFNKMIQVGLRHKEWPVVNKAAAHFAQMLRNEVDGIVLGPATPVISRIKNLCLQDVLIKMPMHMQAINRNKLLIDQLMGKLHENAEFKSVRFHLDVDP